jgi:hypothetical protein
MGAGLIFLKNFHASLFNKELSNETTFLARSISLDSTFKGQDVFFTLIPHLFLCEGFGTNLFFQCTSITPKYNKSLFARFVKSGLCAKGKVK